MCTKVLHDPCPDTISASSKPTYALHSLESSSQTGLHALSCTCPLFEHCCGGQLRHGHSLFGSAPACNSHLTNSVSPAKGARGKSISAAEGSLQVCNKIKTVACVVQQA